MRWEFRACWSKVGLVRLEESWRRLVGFTFRIWYLVNSSRWILATMKSLSHARTNSCWLVKWSKHLVDPPTYCICIGGKLTVYNFMSTTEKMLSKGPSLKSQMFLQLQHLPRGIRFFPRLTTVAGLFQNWQYHWTNCSFRAEQTMADFWLVDRQKVTGLWQFPAFGRCLAVPLKWRW